MKKKLPQQPDTIERFYPDPSVGLSSVQVESRIQQGLANISPKPPSKSIGRIIYDNVFTLFNALNLVLAALLFLVGSYLNATFVLIALANILIGTVQEIRSKMMVEKLSLINAPGAHVLRDGQATTITVEELVLDDIMVLSTGNQICTDALVVEGSLELDESLLTGESDPVLKQAGDLLLSGSFVVSGQCKARVEHVGVDSYAAGIAQDARSHKKPNSELMRSLNGILRFVSVIIVPIGLLLIGKQLFLLDMPIKPAVESTVAACIGMIPEGLVLLTSVAMAVGVIRLAQKRTLVQELYCIETLARVDVLCLDKTGTLTQGDMQVRGVYPLADTHKASIEEALGALCAALPDHNPTIDAIRSAYPTDPGWHAAHITPFSSARKWSGATFEKAGSFVLGAPEFVLGDGARALQHDIQAYTAAGERVLVLAGSPNPLESTQLCEALTPLALLSLTDIIREEAPDTLAYFASQDVDIKIISGDNPQTVSQIAQRAGVQHADRVVDAATLTTDEQLHQAAKEYTVFGRVTPQQKRGLVHALQAAGHTVAMTGDGVNDVLALKDADCSIAMHTGSDAARHVAQIVLLDSNFASMPRVVAEGRRVINNIHRAASLFLVKTIFSFLLSLIFLFMPSSYPFVPIQLSLISALMVGIPSFFLALEPDTSRFKGKFLVNVIRKALPGALTIVLCIGAIHAITLFMPLSAKQISTLATLLTGTTSWFVLLNVCKPMDLKRGALCLLMAAAFVIAVLCFGHIVQVNVYDLRILPVMLPMLVLVPLLMRLLRYLLDRTPWLNTLDSVIKD